MTHDILAMFGQPGTAVAKVARKKWQGSPFPIITSPIEIAWRCRQPLSDIKCCNVLQCIAVHCSVLQCVAGWFKMSPTVVRNKFWRVSRYYWVLELSLQYQGFDKTLWINSNAQESVRDNFAFEFSLYYQHIANTLWVHSNAPVLFLIIKRVSTQASQCHKDLGEFQVDIWENLPATNNTPNSQQL